MSVSINSYKSRYQKGLSLIELMIGIAISLIILAGVITAFININATSIVAIKSARLNQELRLTMDFIGRELQKAGYVNAWDDSDPDDPKIDDGLIETFGSVTIGKSSDGSVCVPGTAGCDCIMYTYDLDEDSVLDANEYYGFRLGSGPGGVLGTIEIKTSNGPSNCNTGTWLDLTDEELDITSLTFVIDTDDDQYYKIRNGDGTVSDCSGTNPDGSFNCVADDDSGFEADSTILYRRKVNVVLDGELANDASVTSSYRSEIKLVNDYYYTK